MEQFIEYGIPAVAPGADAAGLGPELDHLAAGLDALPRVLSHRDYHYQNLFLQRLDGAARIRVIDFQDALMAPAAQDFAVLLTTRDTGALIAPALEVGVARLLFRGDRSDAAPPRLTAPRSSGATMVRVAACAEGHRPVCIS